MKKIAKIPIPLIAVASTTITNFGLVGCGDSYMKEIKQEVLDEFMGNTEKQIAGITSVPRPGYYHAKIIPYLKKRIKEITNLTDDDIHVQPGGVDNIYFDLPASKGYENKDMVILQGHTDMVVAGMTEDDAKKEPIIAVLDGNTIHSKDFKTSLGADNGIGIAIMLYLAKHTNDFKHGPLRFLMTADEDVGMVGASKLDESWLKDPNNNSIKWLLNIDSEKEGCIYNSCAGNVRMIYSNNYTTSSPSDDDQNLTQYEIYLDGFKGGHSAFDILDKRANADKVAFTFLKEAITLAKQNKKIVRLVALDHKNPQGKNIGYSANQLIANSHLIIASDWGFDSLHELFIQILLRTCNSQYTGEVYQDVHDKSSLNVAAQGYKQTALSINDTEKLAQVFGNNDTHLGEKLNSFYYGVFDDIENSDLPPAPHASGNIGPIELTQSTQMTNRTCLTGWSSCRSSVGDQTQPLSIDWLKEQYTAVAQRCGFEHIEEGPIYYPWLDNGDNNLITILQEGFTKNGVESFTYGSPGGVEPAWWYAKSNGFIKCACIGSKIDNAHSKTETLYVDTIAPIVKTTIYALEQLSK